VIFGIKRLISGDLQKLLPVDLPTLNAPELPKFSLKPEETSKMSLGY